MIFSLDIMPWVGWVGLLGLCWGLPWRQPISESQMRVFLLVGSVFSAVFFVVFALYGRAQWLLEWSILLGSMNYLFIGLMLRSFRLDMKVAQLRRGSAASTTLMVVWTLACFYATEAINVASSFWLGQLMLGWLFWEFFQYARTWPSASAKGMAAVVALQWIDNCFRTWMVLIGNPQWALFLQWMLLLLGLMVMLLLFGVLQQRKAMHEKHLVNSLAHELRQPLGAMRLKLEHLIHDASSLQPHQSHELLHQLISENDRAAAIIQGLRRFFDMNPLQRGVVNLSQLLDATVVRVTPDLRSRGIALVSEVAPGVQVMGDAAQLDMVIFNVLLNAREALEDMDGPVDRCIVLTLRCVQGKAELLVSDNGPGIARDDADRIFDIHFTRKAKGTGLGLWLCKTVVQEHGGVMCLQPSPKGASFLVRLPLLSPAHSGG